MTNHSPEPWKRGTDGLIFDANNELVTDTCGSSLPPSGEDNQKRIVACVNAMQGIEDPEAEIEWLCEELERLRIVLRDINDIARDAVAAEEVTNG